MISRPPRPYTTWLDAAVASFPNTNIDIGDIPYEDCERGPREELQALRDLELAIIADPRLIRELPRAQQDHLMRQGAEVSLEYYRKDAR